MAVHLRHLMFGQLGALRLEPTDKRIRARWDGLDVVDSRRAMLVWEPKRIVPSYAVPVEDIAADVHDDVAREPVAPDGLAAVGAPQLGDRLVLDPSVPFAVHTTVGTPSVVEDGHGRSAEAYLPSDPELAGYALLEFDGFDEWFEEDEPNVAHPRDPFHRVDVLRSSRHVRLELEGVVLAESSSPLVLFEPPLPPRYYLTADEVHTELLEPSDAVTYCAYKGRATYWSVAGEQDLAWSYELPLHDAAEVAGRIAFFDERVDVFVDGVALDRPITPWSRRPA